MRQNEVRGRGVFVSREGMESYRALRPKDGDDDDAAEGEDQGGNLHRINLFFEDEDGEDEDEDGLRA